jgi:hypothetical protein
MEADGVKLSGLSSRLGIDLESRLAEALSVEAAQLADSLRAELAILPGGPHTHPWQRTGTLRDSIEVEVSNTEASVFSRDPVASLQENGTATLPPRPTFGPLAAVAGPGIARRLGEAARAALSSDTAKEH